MCTENLQTLKMVWLLEMDSPPPRNPPPQSGYSVVTQAIISIGKYLYYQHPMNVYPLHNLDGKTEEHVTENDNSQNTKQQLHTWGFSHGFERLMPYGLCRSSPRPQTMTIWQVRQTEAKNKTKVWLDFIFQLRSLIFCISVTHIKHSKHHSFRFLLPAFLASINWDIVLSFLFCK